MEHEAGYIDLKITQQNYTSLIFLRAMHVHVHVHVHIHICMYIYIHTHTHIYVTT